MSNSIEKHNRECMDEAAESASKVTGFSQVEEASPDLLKNTPSNITRLEDVIEQCKGRQKYLARTKSPSDGEDVRWYFCKVPLAGKDLAASVPRTEIVGKGDYFRFSLRDSLALEASFLQREEELLSHWWKEYAECSEGPSGHGMASRNILDMQCKDEQSNELYAVDEERVGVPVKGGLYEVDLIKRHCFSVYWHGENRRVLRGHWFARKAGLDWLPLREDVAEQLELAYRCQVWHRRTFQPSGLFAARIDLQATTPGLHALFIGEDNTWEAWLGVDNSGFALNTGRGNKIKLRRGFSSPGSSKPTQDELRQQREEEMDDYCSQVPVGHLVFMVHGIGQRMDNANLVDDVGNFRRVTESLAERHLSPYQRGTQRVFFIPCQWRIGLKLSGESAVEKITLDGVRGLRKTLSATVHDILYYMSPIYCQNIIDSVSNQLNRLYRKFLKRNPGYHGKVSLFGHSLGSVLSYDILCHQESLSSPFSMESLHIGAVSKEECQVDPCSQFRESSYIMTSEHDSININVETSELTSATEEGCLISNPNATVLVDSTNDLSLTAGPSLSSYMEEGSSKICGIPDPEEGSQGSLQQIADDKQSIDMPLLDLHSRATFFSEQMDLDANVNVTGGAPSVVKTVTDDLYEDISDKGKLITLLEEEVKSLKARIVELELKRNSTTSINSMDHYKNEFCQDNKEDIFNMDQDVSRKSYTHYIKYTKLDFKVDTFFAVGSPLGVFLALRNIRIGIGRGQEYWQDETICEEMPSCRQMFNIFHPFDPVAYRVEPLVCKEYINRRPVIIPYYKGGKRMHIGFQEFTEDIAARSEAVVSHLNSMRVKVVNVFRSRNKDDMEESVEDVQVKEKSYGTVMMERLTGSEDGRIDHMLQDETFQLAYISAIGSHTNYWRDHDTALFILKHLYRDVLQEPSTNETPNCKRPSENKGRQVGPFLQRGAMDEDTPLTFSDHSLIQSSQEKQGRL